MCQCGASTPPWLNFSCRVHSLSWALWCVEEETPASTRHPSPREEGQVFVNLTQSTHFHWPESKPQF